MAQLFFSFKNAAINDASLRTRHFASAWRLLRFELEMFLDSLFLVLFHHSRLYHRRLRTAFLSSSLPQLCYHFYLAVRLINLLSLSLFLFTAAAAAFTRDSICALLNYNSL